MIDSHCHLDLQAFDADLDEVLLRSTAAGVRLIHVPGTTVQGWHKQRVIADKYGGIDYSIGLHPYFLNENSFNDIKFIETQLAVTDTQPVAIGEIGLDNAIDVDFAMQKKMCLAQLEIAKSAGLPVVLHHRKSQHNLLQILKQSKFKNGGILHAFSGSPDMASRFIDAGFLLGIGGTITYERAKKTREAVRQTDISHLALETDSPDMPLSGYQGRRNEPMHTASVCKALAELIQRDEKDIAEITSQNYLRNFSRNRSVDLSR